MHQLVSFIIVKVHPGVQIALKSFQRIVNLLSELAAEVVGVKSAETVHTIATGSFEFLGKTGVFGNAAATGFEFAAQRIETLFESVSEELP